ncbi:hypothetical protein ACJX0J_015041, partial [Zea mays]
FDEEIYKTQPQSVIYKNLHIPNGSFMYLLLYVDDMLIASHDKPDLAHVWILRYLKGTSHFGEGN